MVFKMITSGKHVKKVNGKFFKDQEFNLDVNPNGQNKILIPWMILCVILIIIIILYLN